MPEIIKDEKQTIALNEVSDMLAIVRNINTMLGEGQGYSITFPGKGSKTVKVDVEDADRGKVEAMLLSYKGRLARAIESRVRNYRISLSEEEKDTISLAPSAAEKPEKKEKPKKGDVPEEKPSENA